MEHKSSIEAARSMAPDAAHAGRTPQNAPPILVIDDLIRARALDEEQITLLSFPKSERSVTDFEHFRGTDLDRFVDHAAKYYISKGLEPNDEKNKTVAQLGVTDLAYIITFFALSRLGYTVLCLSPRLSPHACAKLMEECGAFAVIPGKTPLMSKLVAESQTLVPIDMVETVSREDFDKPESHVKFMRGKIDREAERHWVGCVLHSSGTTGLPRPIHIPHRRLMMQIPPPPGQLEFNTFPMFHGYGNWIIMNNTMCRKSTHMYNPNLPVTAEYIIKVVEHLKPDVLHVVPYTMELLALSERGINAMKSCQRVAFSGGACPDDLGDSLTEKGVTVESVWGATEMGSLGTSCGRPPGDNAWDYIRIPKPINDHIWMKPVEDDMYECIYLKGLPALVVSNSNDPPGSFWSNDLFKKHPSIPNAWKHIGRLDDRLTLVNGEKVLPVPMEGRIRQDPLILEACVFGTGRSFPGVLVFRNDDSAKMSDGEFIDKIWPTIQAANSHAESFSQISKETIIPMGANVDYPKTDKESIKRAQIYTVFTDVIEAMYEKLACQGTGTLQLDIPELEKWLLDTFNHQVGVPLSSVNDDFFVAGVNSLQAIQVRGLILKDIDLGGHARKLGQNVVFDMGTVARLARCVRSLRLSEQMPADDRDEIQEMVALIRKYSAFKMHTPGTKITEGKHVLLTGVTGSLGAELLAQCLNNPSIRHTYCLVRGAKPEKRVQWALHQRCLIVPPSPNLTVFAADLSDPSLGLSAEDYNTLRSSITHIIHSAWAVNFNIGIGSFEKDHLAGVHHLLQFSLSSQSPTPLEFYFCSSIAAGMGTPAPATVPEGPIDNLAHALPQGYARSKLVAEHIIRNAAHNFGARARILRIGQIVGEKKTGLWNDTEAVPLIIRSALTLNALPELEEIESWLPVDTLASSICELAGLSEGCKVPIEDQDLVYNLENPSTFHWAKDLLPELSLLGMKFETVSPSAWLEKLRAYKGNADANPAVKLLGHFESIYAKGGTVEEESDNKRGVKFDLTTAKKNSPSLRTAPQLVKDGYIKKFVEAWMNKWQGGNGFDVESSG